MDEDTVESLQDERLALQKELLAVYVLLTAALPIALRALLTRDAPVSLMDQQSLWQRIREVEDVADIEIHFENSGELTDDENISDQSIFFRLDQLRSFLYPRS